MGRLKFSNTDYNLCPTRSSEQAGQTHMMPEPWGGGDDPSPTFSADDFISYFTMLAILHLALSASPFSVFPPDLSLKCLYFFGVYPGLFLLLILYTLLWESSTPVASIHLKADDSQVYRSSQDSQISLARAERAMSPSPTHLKSRLCCPLSQLITSFTTMLFEAKSLESLLTSSFQLITHKLKPLGLDNPARAKLSSLLCRIFIYVVKCSCLTGLILVPPGFTSLSLASRSLHTLFLRPGTHFLCYPLLLYKI